MSPTSFWPGRSAVKSPGDEVGDVVFVAVLLGQAGSPGAGLAGLQAQLTHDGADELGAAGHAGAGELGVDAAVAVGLVGGTEGVGDQDGELLASLGGRGVRAPAPVEETRRGHVQPCAHFLHRVGVLRVR
jgi:hypothetical protein